jgi:hypothetical protein
MKLSIRRRRRRRRARASKYREETEIKILVYIERCQRWGPERGGMHAERKVVCSFPFKINWTVLKDLMAKVLEGPPLLLIDSD